MKQNWKTFGFLGKNYDNYMDFDIFLKFFIFVNFS